MTDFETMQKFMSQVQFTYKKGWYRESDVDTFIDTLLGMLGDLQKKTEAIEEENTSLHSKNDALEKENTALRSQAEKPEVSLQTQSTAVIPEPRSTHDDYEELKAQLAEMKQKESAIAAVMVQAEQTASQTIARGKAEADRLIAEAKEKSVSFAAEAAAAREAAIRSCDDVKQQLELLNREKTEFISRILGQMDLFSDRLHAMEQTAPASVTSNQQKNSAAPYAADEPSLTDSLSDGNTTALS